MKVVVYVIDDCPHCSGLLADLRRRRVEHEVVNLSRSPDRAAEVFSLVWERRVPVLIDHERVSVGFKGGSSVLGGGGEPRR